MGSAAASGPTGRLSVTRETVRMPAAAGRLYPADPSELARTVDRLLRAASGRVDRQPWGIVVPHAGYVYSGPVAATAYAALRPWSGPIRRVLLLGPAHFVPLEGCVVPVASAWRTPLGDVAIDDRMRDHALVAGCEATDEPHGPEHALEVQLPFLQRLIGEAVRVLPVAVGPTEERDVATVVDAVASDLVVISTDLSHYLDIGAARRADRRTAEALLTGNGDAIGPDAACGLFALRGVVSHASARGRPFELLDLRTSGDTAGDMDRVVGYGAFAIGA